MLHPPQGLVLELVEQEPAPMLRSVLVRPPREQQRLTESCWLSPVQQRHLQLLFCSK